MAVAGEADIAFDGICAEVVGEFLAGEGIFGGEGFGAAVCDDAGGSREGCGEDEEAEPEEAGGDDHGWGGEPVGGGWGSARLYQEEEWSQFPR